MNDRRLELGALLVVTALGAVVALSRNPDGAVVERAKSWPLVGPWAARLQRSFREAPPAPPATPPAAPEIVVLRLTVPEPSAEAAPPEPERAGRRRATPPRAEERLDRSALPVLPLASRPPDPVALARAVGLLGPGARSSTIGPYAIVAAFDPPPRWSALAGSLDAAFLERTGVAPVGEPAETVVVFRDRARYRELARLEPRLAGLDPAGHAAAGLAVIAADEPVSDAAEATLVHELVHFVERRAVGPSLPAWLAEGLAEDLAWSRFDEIAGLRSGTLRDGLEASEQGIAVSGAVAGLEELASAIESGRASSLAALVALDDHGFAAGDGGPLRYAQALWWIRFLLDGDDPALARGLRDFLAEAARGGAVEAAALERALGATLAELEPAFRDFVLSRRGSEVDARLVELAGPGRRVVLGGREIRGAVRP